MSIVHHVCTNISHVVHHAAEGLVKLSKDYKTNKSTYPRAVVWDIDDTILRSPQSKIRPNELVSMAVMQLYQLCLKLGLTVFFVTARPDSPDNRTFTKKQLLKHGFSKYEVLLMLPVAEYDSFISQGRECNFSYFKHRMRSRIADLGYSLDLVIGDSFYDLLLMPPEFTYAPDDPRNQKNQRFICSHLIHIKSPIYFENLEFAKIAIKLPACEDRDQYESTSIDFDGFKRDTRESKGQANNNSDAKNPGVQTIGSFVKNLFKRKQSNLLLVIPSSKHLVPRGLSHFGMNVHSCNEDIFTDDSQVGKLLAMPEFHVLYVSKDISWNFIKYGLGRALNLLAKGSIVILNSLPSDCVHGHYGQLGQYLVEESSDTGGSDTRGAGVNKRSAARSSASAKPIKEKDVTTFFELLLEKLKHAYSLHSFCDENVRESLKIPMLSGPLILIKK